jgi:hypothetical protein
MAMKDLDTKLEETTATPWHVWYELLVAYKAEHGNCLVPYFYVTPNGYALWYWVSKLRVDKARGLLTDEQIREIDELEFVWVLQDDTWEEGFAALQAYKAEFGDCLVPSGYTTKNHYKLGTWVRDQRVFDGNYPREKFQRLFDLGFVWNISDYDWNNAFESLKTYKAEYGDCRVPRAYVTDNGFELGAWVADQRTDLHYGHLEKDKVQKLEAVGFSWGPWEDTSPVIFVPRTDGRGNSKET